MGHEKGSKRSWILMDCVKGKACGPFLSCCFLALNLMPYIGECCVGAP